MLRAIISERSSSAMSQRQRARAAAIAAVKDCASGARRRSATDASMDMAWFHIGARSTAKMAALRTMREGSTPADTMSPNDWTAIVHCLPLPQPTRRPVAVMASGGMLQCSISDASADASSHRPALEQASMAALRPMSSSAVRWARMVVSRSSAAVHCDPCAQAARAVAKFRLARWFSARASARVEVASHKLLSPCCRCSAVATKLLVRPRAASQRRPRWQALATVLLKTSLATTIPACAVVSSTPSASAQRPPEAQTLAAALKI
mmetsp:Transcript_60069/g.196120  ORF Transcript_60069/g.196120 Transcript_60069/m.196120 type:complete len:265 (-) Transcript_60069:1154-1948(-)